MEPTGTFTEARPMTRLGRDEPPLSTTPGLAEIVETAYRVDDYIFLEFTADAKYQGKPAPSRFFLLPGGFAYEVDPIGPAGP